MKLSIENSWWNKGGLWQDSDLTKVKNSPLNYHPRPFAPDLCNEKAVLTLRGPRRVGKTVSLKLLVAELIEQEGWEGKDIVWTSFDTFRRLDQVEEHVVGIVEKFSPKLLLVDEVTAVTGWQRGIKKLRDNGILASQCIILTGSSAYDLKAGAERMAGRRGDVENPDRVLLPMGYQNFCAQLEKNKIVLSSEEAVRFYLQVGGFPFRIEKFMETYSTPWDPMSGLQVFDDVFFYEFIRRKLDRSIALEILGRLSVIQCSATSYHAFNKPLALAKETARKYLDALGDAFLLATIYSYDTARGRVSPKKDKKFCWIDPALGFLAAKLNQGEVSEESSRAEWAVGTELMRRYETRSWEGLSAPRNVFTWKSSGGHEIDYLIINKSKKIQFPVEVKYKHSISDWDFQVMERVFGCGWIVTPNIQKTRPMTQAMSLDKFFTFRC